ncbi:hypothetical protein EDD85DRAFT_962837 [Armillaria nabsnona]|nr:hypothetical protein EDD85DRAFT_962837 [Armillaria nabsnona]
MAVRLCPNPTGQSPFLHLPPPSLPSHYLPINLSMMISTSRMNLAFRRAFTSWYQKRETEVEASRKSKTTQSHVSILAGRTTAATINRPHQENKEPTAGMRAGLPQQRFQPTAFCHLVRAPSPKTNGWNQEVLKGPRYSDGIVIFIYVTLLFNAIPIIGNVRLTFRGLHHFGLNSGLRVYHWVRRYYRTGTTIGSSWFAAFHSFHTEQ